MSTQRWTVSGSEAPPWPMETLINRVDQGDGSIGWVRVPAYGAGRYRLYPGEVVEYEEGSDGMYGTSPYVVKIHGAPSKTAHIVASGKQPRSFKRLIVTDVNGFNQGEVLVDATMDGVEVEITLVVKDLDDVQHPVSHHVRIHAPSRRYRRGPMTQHKKGYRRGKRGSQGD